MDISTELLNAAETALRRVERVISDLHPHGLLEGYVEELKYNAGADLFCVRFAAYRDLADDTLYSYTFVVAVFSDGPAQGVTESEYGLITHKAVELTEFVPELLATINKDEV